MLVLRTFRFVGGARLGKGGGDGAVCASGDGMRDGSVAARRSLRVRLTESRSKSEAVASGAATTPVAPAPPVVGGPPGGA
eukprot:3958976-Prymnesium_polylepis.2